MAINLTPTQKKAVDAISANDGVHVEFSKETGFISLVTTKALVKKGVLKYIGETGKWRKRTWVLAKQADPATCDICGEHQPHVATDGDNDVDVCDECADMAEANNSRPFITADPASEPTREILLLMPGEYPYTRPAQPKLSGELERLLRKPRLAQVITPRVVDESVSERDLWDIWAKLGTEPVDYIPEPEPTPDPVYAAWQTKKAKNLWATVFVKAQDGTFATFAQDAATLTGVVYPQSKVIMTSYFLPTQINAQSKRALSLEKAAAALRAANKSYVVFVGDSVIMQFVAGRESGMSGMKLGADKSDRRMVS